MGRRGAAAHREDFVAPFKDVHTRNVQIEPNNAFWVNHIDRERCARQGLGKPCRPVPLSTRILADVSTTKLSGLHLLSRASASSSSWRVAEPPRTPPTRASLVGAQGLVSGGCAAKAAAEVSGSPAASPAHAELTAIARQSSSPASLVQVPCTMTHWGGMPMHEHHPRVVQRLDWTRPPDSAAPASAPATAPLPSPCTTPCCAGASPSRARSASAGGVQHPDRPCDQEVYVGDGFASMGGARGSSNLKAGSQFGTVGVGNYHAMLRRPPEPKPARRLPANEFHLSGPMMTYPRTGQWLI